jgi:hypothetical protein
MSRTTAPDTQLSPAAQAVMDAYINAPCGKSRGVWVAAALRAAADQARRGPEHWEGSQPDDFDKGWDEAIDWVAMIAAELDNS